MKRVFALLMMLVLLLCSLPANADEVASPSAGARLTSLKHNCPNTGIMLPRKFKPDETTYLLTVADWVSTVSFTPVAENPAAVITVNGRKVKSGKASQGIAMTDRPQMVTIVVTNGAASTTYSIFLQRRPSEKRTRVSAGYINSITQKNGKWYIDADLVTVTYRGKGYETGSLATVVNNKQETGAYRYAVSPHCDFYCGTPENATYCSTLQEFIANNQSSTNTLYRFVYIQSEIVAVYPYTPD